MKILALDLGTHTGWALSLADGPMFRTSGVQVFDVRRGESPGMRFLRLHRWLVDFPHRPELVVYEQAIRQGGAATAVALGFEAHLLSWCAQFGVQHAPVNLQTLKKWTTGHGGAGKGAMVAAVSRRFGTALDLDDNEADAVALLEYARANIVADELREVKA